MGFSNKVFVNNECLNSDGFEKGLIKQNQHMEKNQCEKQSDTPSYKFCCGCNRKKCMLINSEKDSDAESRIQTQKKVIQKTKNNSPMVGPIQHFSLLSSILKDKNILITGATGSIGKTILRQVLLYKPKHVTLLSRDEHKQLEMKKFYGKRYDIDFQLGDIRNLSILMSVCKNQDVVFHTAALKDVVSDELNPWEAIETNVIGTRNIIEASIERNVRKVINISTDKAVYPTSVLGGSKMLAERLITDANKKQKNTIFCNVRFGNVIGSRGSVIPVLVKQIRKKRIITITDPDMTRFMMTLDDAVKLVLHAAAISKGGETIVLKMKSICIEQLIKAIKLMVAEKDGIDLECIKTKVIGSRKGEKIHEMLLSKEESSHVTEKDSFLIINQNEINDKSNNFDQKWIYSNTTDKLSNLEISRIVSKYLEQDEDDDVNAANN